jgi:hypothetical protein
MFADEKTELEGIEPIYASSIISTTTSTITKYETPLLISFTSRYPIRHDVCEDEIVLLPSSSNYSHLGLYDCYFGYLNNTYYNANITYRVR